MKGIWIIFVIVFQISAISSQAQVTGGICSIEYKSVNEKQIIQAIDSLFKKHILFNDSGSIYLKTDPYYGYDKTFHIAMFLADYDTLVFEFRIDDIGINEGYKIGVIEYAKYGNKLHTRKNLTKKELRYFMNNFRTIVLPSLDKYVGKESQWRNLWFSG